ncbi:MAG: hypothetical protein WKG07_33810 [Hymenobacter sp.]
MIQQPLVTVVDEDIADGTLAANHRAVVLTSITYLDPKAVKALEDFIAGGGLAMMTGDSTVKIRRRQPGVTPDFPDAALIKKLTAEQSKEVGKYMTVGKYLEGHTAPRQRYPGAVGQSRHQAGFRVR